MSYVYRSISPRLALAFLGTNLFTSFDCISGDGVRLSSLHSRRIYKKGDDVKDTRRGANKKTTLRGLTKDRTLVLFEGAQMDDSLIQKKTKWKNKYSSPSKTFIGDDTANMETEATRWPTPQPPLWPSTVTASIPSSILHFSSVSMCEGCFSNPDIEAAAFPTSQPTLHHATTPSFPYPSSPKEATAAIDTFLTSSPSVFAIPIDPVPATLAGRLVNMEMKAAMYPTSQPTIVLPRSTSPADTTTASSTVYTYSPNSYGLPVDPNPTSRTGGVENLDIKEATYATSLENRTAISPTLQPAMATQTVSFPTFIVSDTSTVPPTFLTVETSKIPTHWPLLHQMTPKQTLFNYSEVSSSEQFTSPSSILQEGRITDVVMVLDDCPLLNEESIQIWENVTANNIKVAMTLTTIESVNSFDNISVIVHFLNQSNSNYSFDATVNNIIGGDVGCGGSSQSPLVIQFDGVVSFYSPSLDHNLSNYFVSAFGNNEEGLDYLVQLQSSGLVEPNSRIKRVALILNGVEILQTALKSTNRKQRLSTEFSFLGIGLYSICLLLIAVVVVAKVVRGCREYVTRDDRSTVDETGLCKELKFMSLDVSSISDPVAMDIVRVPWEMCMSCHNSVFRKSVYQSSPTISFDLSDMSPNPSLELSGVRGTDLFSLDESTIDDASQVFQSPKNRRLSFID